MVISNLAVMGYAKAFTLWLYKAAVAFEAVEAPGYCNRAAGMLEDGDLIVVAAPDGTGCRQIAIADGVVTLQAPR